MQAEKIDDNAPIKLMDVPDEEFRGYDRNYAKFAQKYNDENLETQFDAPPEYLRGYQNFIPRTASAIPLESP